MTISVLVIEFGKKNIVLKQVLSIHYLLRFLKQIINLRALINLGSQFSTIILAYAASLGQKIWSTNIRAQKIDSFTL